MSGDTRPELVNDGLWSALRDAIISVQDDQTLDYEYPDHCPTWANPHFANLLNRLGREAGLLGPDDAILTHRNCMTTVFGLSGSPPHEEVFETWLEIFPPGATRPLQIMIWTQRLLRMSLQPAESGVLVSYLRAWQEQRARTLLPGCPPTAGDTATGTEIPTGHATPPPTAELPSPGCNSPQGNWLTPTSLTDLANRLGNVGTKKAKTILKPYGLRRTGNRQTWTVCLDGMPDNTRRKLEEGR